MLDAKSPDTSTAHIIRVLRTAIYEECNALADALGHQPDRCKMTPEQWAERVERTARLLEKRGPRICWGDDGDARNKRHYDELAADTLLAAFPESAP